MTNLQTFITENFEIIFACVLVSSVCVFAWLFWLQKQNNVFPEKAKAIIYQENFASGSSHKNWLTKHGGARNCLRLIVTDTELWIRPFFPFSALAGVFDLNHRIPLEKITSISSNKIMFKHSILLSYQDENDENHSVELIPRNFDKFNGALKFNG